jgi:hypothetical protein
MFVVAMFDPISKISFLMLCIKTNDKYAKFRLFGLF